MGGNKEVRDILMGRIVQLEENVWAAAPSNTKFHFHGIRDGAGDVRLFGVTHLSRRYQTAEMDPAIAFAASETALYSMGRPMQLSSIPKSKGGLYAPHWIAPVLITIEQENDKLQMTAYTGRSMLFSWFRCRIALWILERRLPEGITCIGKGAKPNRKEAKQQKAAEKKEKKAASPKGKR